MTKSNSFKKESSNFKNVTTYVWQDNSGDPICEFNTIEDFRKELLNSPINGIDEVVEGNPEKSVCEIVRDYVGFFEVDVLVCGESIGYYNHSYDCDDTAISLEDRKKLKEVFEEYQQKIINHIEGNEIQ